MKIKTIKLNRRMGGVSKTAAGLVLGVIFSLSGVNAAQADDFDKKSDFFPKRSRPNQWNNHKISINVNPDPAFNANDQRKLLGNGSQIFARFPVIHAVGMTVPAGRLMHMADLPIVLR